MKTKPDRAPTCPLCGEIMHEPVRKVEVEVGGDQRKVAGRDSIYHLVCTPRSRVEFVAAWPENYEWLIHQHERAGHFHTPTQRQAVESAVARILGGARPPRVMPDYDEAFQVGWWTYGYCDGFFEARPLEFQKHDEDDEPYDLAWEPVLPSFRGKVNGKTYLAKNINKALYLYRRDRGKRDVFIGKIDENIVWMETAAELMPAILRHTLRQKRGV